MFKDKLGNKLTFKEYMSRWRDGIEKVTPQQQIDWQVRSTWIIIIGIIAGIIISLTSLKTLWWLLIILCGALGNTIVQMIALYQKKLLFNKLFKDESPIKSNQEEQNEFAKR